MTSSDYCNDFDSIYTQDEVKDFIFSVLYFILFFFYLNNLVHETGPSTPRASG
jgi:hypothetical protein